jgi:hypothetical protein
MKYTTDFFNDKMVKPSFHRGLITLQANIDAPRTLYANDITLIPTGVYFEMGDTTTRDFYWGLRIDSIPSSNIVVASTILTPEPHKFLDINIAATVRETRQIKPGCVVAQLSLIPLYNYILIESKK